MSENRKLRLPGIGVRYEFDAESGETISIVRHRSGRREVYVSRPDDPDDFRRVLQLNAADALTMADLLGPREVRVDALAC